MEMIYAAPTRKQEVCHQCIYKRGKKYTDQRIEDTNKKISHVHGSEELILFKCPHYSKPSTDSMQSLPNSNGILTILKF